MISQEKLAKLINTAELAKKVCAIINTLAVGEAWVAGGIVRDLWAAQTKGVDLEGSGDIDILLISCPNDNLDQLGAFISAALGIKGIKAYCSRVDYSYESTEDYQDADDRLYGVMQFSIYSSGAADASKIELDILVYEEQFQTLEDVMDTFNCNINKFWFDENGDGVTTFSPEQPFFYREGDREKNEERYEKCVMRYNMVAKAAHPYQRIGEHESMLSEQVDAQLPC